MSHETQGSTGENTHPHPSDSGGQTVVSPEAVYQGRRDTAAPVGEECTVNVDSVPLDVRYDLLSASPSGFEWGCGGSGPAQLAIAILVHAYDDEFAREYYQAFKNEIITELPKDGWTLTKSDLDEWREVNLE